MQKRNFWVCVLTIFIQGSHYSWAAISSQEWNEVQNRLKAFYASPKDPKVMGVKVPSYDLKSGKFTTDLHGPKRTPAFEKAYCEDFLKPHFPGLKCDRPVNEWSTVQANDRVENLTHTWLSDVTYDMEKLPVVGKSNRPLWSDDYWRVRWGQTSFRYADFEEKQRSFTYGQMIRLYSQPQSWLQSLTLQAEEQARKLVRYSPSEKYDLSTGDQRFYLTSEEKNAGVKYLKDGDVEGWMGICHGWAPAAIMSPRPLKAVTVTGARGTKITWYPNDIKAMLSLKWARAQYKGNYIGGRCNSKNVSFYPNGRVASQECFDNNPSTFHVSLANMIGIAGESFVMDRTYDYQVWNQPIVSYEFTYFNPLDPTKQSKNWKAVAADYDVNFKQQDRFQNPLTRGQDGNDSYIKKIVGVIASVSYVVETSPRNHSPEPDEDSISRTTYTYDLELQERNGVWLPLGGEWHENVHPDFLWVPEKTALPIGAGDFYPVQYAGTPNTYLTSVAQYASSRGEPLCKVLKHLLKESTGTDTFLCP